MLYGLDKRLNEGRSLAGKSESCPERARLVSETGPIFGTFQALILRARIIKDRQPPHVITGLVPVIPMA
jgi:hypothetical protein